MKGKEGLGRKGSVTIVALKPVNIRTRGTIARTRRRAKGDVTRCSLHFLGPLSRDVLRRVNGEFGRIIAIRSNILGNKVNDTVLRFVTSGRCGPRVGHVKLPSRFIRRNSMGRLCRVYNVSRRNVCGILVSFWREQAVGVVVTKTKTMNARLTGLLSSRGRSVVLVSRGRRGLDGLSSGFSLVAIGTSPASVSNLGGTKITNTSLFVKIVPRRDHGVATYVLTAGVKTGGAMTQVSGCRCLLPGRGRFFSRLKMRSLVCPRVLTTGSVMSTVGVD